jgi:hypothetical protein
MKSKGKSADGIGKKKVAMRTLKGKKGALADRETRQIKGGKKLAEQP